MKAPEKIYLVNDDLNIKREWYKTKQVGFETTEYTRTDTFIEKAVEWLEVHKGAIETEDSSIMGWIPDYFIEDFKNYMKGE